MRLAALLVAVALLGWPATAGAADEEDARPAFDGNAASFSVTATAYTSGPESTGKRPGHPAYGLTATGVRARQGQTIAVDPHRIPLGSRVYIEELDQAFIAEDTGGAIRGDRIDLFMDQLADARQWGVRRVRVQVFPKI